MSRSSLYQRFQDKDGLFQETVARYTERVLRRMNAVRADTMKGRIAALLREFLPKPGKSARPAGCLLARCGAEMPDLSEAGRSVAREGLARQRAVFEGILVDAVKSGELPRDADIDAVAWYYLGVPQALLNLPQAGATPVALQRTIDIAVGAWPGAQASSMNGAESPRARRGPAS